MYESRENILHDIPDAIESEWGAYDEYMFRQILNKLDTVSAPQLIYGLSITNHTPYAPPPGYAAANIPLSDELKTKLANTDDAFLKGFITYQYACNCMAHFIRAIRNGKLADHTIIAITGDHSIKGVIQSPDNDIVGKYGVPLIMYVPDRYLKNKTVDPARWGSHKDIFPTVTNLALSEEPYYYLGDDLFAADMQDGFAVHTGVAALCNMGAISMVNNQLYRWDENTKLLVPIDNDPALQDFKQKVHIWKTVSKYVTLRSLDRH
jgi:phosphoglycerol transferase MdoB-like AlkP superfamily enzyme